MYAEIGRPSIPPEKLLRAQLLQMLYSVRSERLLMEEIDYSILFRWFVGMNLDESGVGCDHVHEEPRPACWRATWRRSFWRRWWSGREEAGLSSDEHFTVDGTLLEAWASLKSFQAKEQKTAAPPDDPGNPTVDFHGEKRSQRDA